MGHKVNPNGYRYGINRNWESRWIAKDNKQMAQWLVEDEKIRQYFIKNYKTAQIVRTEIERTPKQIHLFVYVGQPGGVIGKDGTNIPVITKAINLIVGRKIKVNVNVIAYENVGWSARVIAREIADAIENRVSFRNAQKMAIKKVMMARAIGIKTRVSGRLGGVEMAREEGYSEGIIPLTTLRADLDYALEEANTTYGKIGVKVWINRGEIFGKGLNNQVKPQKPEIRAHSDRPNRRNRSNNNNDTINVAKSTPITTSTTVKVGE